MSVKMTKTAIARGVKKCRVCKQTKPIGEFTRRLDGKIIYYDHCHITGFFRGWLCPHCNTAIGMAKDDPEVLRRLADYLERFYRSDEVMRLCG